ncbi:hypothetical protein ACH5RR_037741 [Cinchona calisaya]|uniref:Uncharacterized protein n=1 Tax=Cinchona calisaya TaxID=153742 RepID=A0ABD2Y730_9GENT
MTIIMGSLDTQKRSKKWYMCFKPEVEKDYNYPFNKTISCSRKESMFRHNNNIFMAFSDDGGNKFDSSSDCEDRMSKDSNSNSKSKSKSKPRRRFSRVVKAFLLQSSLAKKNRSRKSGQEEKSSTRPSNLDKLINSFRNKKSSSCKESSDVDSLLTDSSRSTLFSSSTTTAPSSQSSSRASSLASNSRSESERKKSCLINLKQLNHKPATIYSKRSMNNGSYCNPRVALYFLLICLVALIFWGKAFAIFCTSTCLFLIPCWFKRVDDRTVVNNHNVESVDFDSDEYKKKVIMEGLLERSRHIN